MATQTIRIIVEERGSKQAAQGLHGIAREATAADKALGLLKTALAAVGVGVAIKQYVELSNTYQTLQNRIRLVTSSQQEQIAVTRELLDVSNQTFTSLRNTTELYARLAFNTRNLGLTQQEVLDVTRSLNQAVILSGAGAREASNAIIQLSQGLASGTLRGDELRSVLEQLPFVADVIAESLEVDRSALRRLGAEGAIISEKIVQGLQAAAPRIQAEFDKLTPTIGQAFQVLQNQLLSAVGELNNATGASNFFAESILSIADGLTDVTDIAIAFFEEFSSYAETAGDLLYEAFGVSLEDAQFSFRDFLRFIGAFIDTVTGLFVALGQGIITFWTSVFNSLKGIGERILNGAATVIEAVVNTIIKGINSAIQGVVRSLNGLLEVANDAADFLGQGPIFDPIRLNNLVELDLGRVEETPFIEVGEAVGAAFKEGFNRPQGARNFIDDVLRGADARAARRRAEGRDLGGQVRNPNAGRGFETANGILIAQLRDQLNVERDLLETRSTGSALQIATAQALEKFNRQVRDDKIQLNATQREELEAMVRANAERKVRNELDKQIRDFNQDLEDELNLLNLSSTEREVEADLLRIINAHKEAGIALDQQELANMRAKRAELQQRVIEERILNQVFGDRARLQAEIEATERLRQAETDPNRRRGLERLQAQQRIDSRQGDPSLLAGFDNGLDALYLKVSDVAGGIEQAMTNAFSSAEDALVEFVQTGKFNFSGLVDSILADITRLLARQAVLALFNAISGGTSGAFGGVFSALAGARAEGGPVSQGRPYLVGERGPEIFQPNQSGTIIPNGASPAAAPQTNITVVNVTDPKMVSAALNDPESQQVIVNVIGKNRIAVNRALGQG
jgi:lambda family phage tail tape measure protein